MRNNLTSVEWLFNELQKAENDYRNEALDGREYTAKKSYILEHAKKMQKEQLENAWYAGDEDGAIHEFEYYYNETFKKTKMTQTALDLVIEQLKEQIRKSAHNTIGTTNRTGDYRIGLIKAIGLCVQAKEMEKDTVKAKEETRAAEITLRIDGVLTRFIHEDEYKSMIDAYEKEVKELHDRNRNQSKIIKDRMDILGKINSLIK